MIRKQLILIANVRMVTEWLREYHTHPHLVLAQYPKTDLCRSVSFTLMINFARR